LSIQNLAQKRHLQTSTTTGSDNTDVNNGNSLMFSKSARTGVIKEINPKKSAKNQDFLSYRYNIYHESSYNSTTSQYDQPKGAQKKAPNFIDSHYPNSRDAQKNFLMEQTNAILYSNPPKFFSSKNVNDNLSSATDKSNSPCKQPLTPTLNGPLSTSYKNNKNDNSVASIENSVRNLQREEFGLNCTNQQSLELTRQTNKLLRESDVFFGRKEKN
jgi:hypothetical protein